MNMLSYSALFAAAVSAGSGGYDYKTNNGDDWPNLNIDGNKCGSTNQSPIDLKSEGWPKYEAMNDNFNKVYTNIDSGEMKWVGDTTKLTYGDVGVNTFDSRLASHVYGGPQRFNGAQFHFHSPSEHSVDGKLMDLEMHTVHLPAEAKGGIKYAAFGIMFDVENPTYKWDDLEDY
jgi:carbonic anhydrase